MAQTLIFSTLSGKVVYSDSAGLEVRNIDVCNSVIRIAFNS